jgi:hypothetical protein
MPITVTMPGAFEAEGMLSKEEKTFLRPESLSREIKEETIESVIDSSPFSKKQW